MVRRGPRVKRLDIVTNQFWLQPAKDDLRKRGIDINDLIIVRSSLTELFHPTTMLQQVKLVPIFHYDNLGYKMEDLTEYVIGLAARRREKNFKAHITFDFISKDGLICLDGIPYKIDRRFEPLELYLCQRMESQQPQYNYTYRSRTEIK